MALAAGESRLLAPSPLTLHARTAMAVATQMTAAKFKVVEAGEQAQAQALTDVQAGHAPMDVPAGACLVICDGAGVRAAA